MNINNVTRGKAVPLGILIILITYLVGGLSSSVLPFVFFTGIIVALMKCDELAESVVAAFLASLFGSVIVTAITLGFYYVLYGSIYFNYMFMQSLYMAVFYIIVGVIGGIVGYFVSRELRD